VRCCGTEGKHWEENAHMVGVLVLAIAGVVAWKYRDSLSEYVEGNTGPATEQIRSSP